MRGIASLLGTTLGSRIRLAVEPGSGDCAVLADPNQFDTAILNLQQNNVEVLEELIRANVVSSWGQLEATRQRINASQAQIADLGQLREALRA